MTSDPMEGRIVRFEELRRGGTPLAFIDCVLPGHLRMNYAVVGDTAVEDPDFKAALDVPHEFQIGIFECPPGCGPAWHTHGYVELFIPLTGEWLFRYGRDPEGYETPDGEVVLKQWDAISFPPDLWRAFENRSDENAIALAVLDPHERFAFKDPIWPQSIIERAAAAGVHADERGQMIKPPDSDALEQRLAAAIDGTTSIPGRG